MKRKVIKKLQVAAKQAAAVCTQLIAASQGAAVSNRWVSHHSHLYSMFVCILSFACDWWYSLSVYHWVYYGGIKPVYNDHINVLVFDYNSWWLLVSVVSLFYTQHMLIICVGNYFQ